MVFAPMQFAVGGIELVIIMLIVFLLSAPVLALIAIALGWVGWRSRDKERLEELEAEVERLQAEQTAGESEQPESDDVVDSTDE